MPDQAPILAEGDSGHGVHVTVYGSAPTGSANSSQVPFDVAGARAAGYTDAEIADHLGKVSDFDVSGARNAGYSDAEIISHLAAPLTPPSQGAQMQRATADAQKREASVSGLERSIGQGATLNFGDELDAGAAALQTGANNFLRRMTGRPDVGYGMADAYHAVKQVNDQAEASYRAAHPLISTGAQIAGSLLTPGIGEAGDFVSGGATALGRMTRAAGVGAGYGAVAGAGAANGGPVERAKGAGIGAMTGAATGGAVQGGMEASGTAIRALNAATGYRFGSPAASAAARLRQALQADGVAPADIAQAVDEYSRVGATSPTLADVAGENTRALLRTAGSRYGTPARNMLQTYRDETVHGLPDAAINRTQALTPGDGRPTSQVATDLTTARDAAATTDYKPAYGSFMEVPDSVKEMLQDPAGRAIIARARADAVENQDWGAQVELDRLLRPTENGQLPQISGSTLDRLAIAARERGASFAASGRNYRARGAFGRQGQINDLLDAAPGLAEARANYRSYSQAIDAATNGPNILSATPDQFSASLQGLDERGLGALQVKARQDLTDALGRRANAMGTVDQIAYAPNVRHNLTALFGPDEAEQYIQAARLNIQRARNANFMAPNSGSPTFSKGADASAISSVADAVRRPVQTILAKVASGLTLTDAEAEQLVRVGLMSPQDAVAATRPRMTQRVIGSAGARAAAAAAGPAAGVMTRQLSPQP